TPRDRSGEGLLPAPARPVQDAPTPSPNGVAAIAAFRLAELTGASAWQVRAEALVRAFGGSAGSMGLHAATYLQAVDRMVNSPAHLVIVGPSGDPEAATMHRRALATWLPRRHVRRLDPEAASRAPVPAAVAALLPDPPERAARAFLCLGASCRLPAADDAAWAATLASPR
ncbi:MAG TPA: hypothetical protein VK012_01980, partial [Gemmatimonadales bacterium]|nr:hypothetical protein [Gemmatimonadales bacterium]